jgi:uncharacterized membrane protein YeaQ/YmgE (transglycosylase-associated protein family)
MKHYAYIAFQSPEAAEAAMRELAGSPVEIHPVPRSLASTETEMTESGARHGFLLGIVLGGLLGALTGWILGGPFGIFDGLAMPMAFGTVIGAIIGGLGGTLFSSGEPDRKLEKLARDTESGAILMSLHAPDEFWERKAEEIAIRYGARIEHRPRT